MFELCLKHGTGFDPAPGTTYTFQKFNPFEEEIRRFVENCTTGRKSVPGINEAYMIDKIIDACYTSSKGNSLVQL